MHILVTGASRGIGNELVKQFALTEGNNVIAVSRNMEKLSDLEQECKKNQYPGNVTTVPFDITSKDDIERIRSETIMRFGQLDILINNAGYLHNHSFENFPEDEMKKVFDVNFFAVVTLIQSLLPLLEQSKVPHIVNISSMGGFQGSLKFPGLSMYSSSKGALSILTECLAVELKEKDIRVNCLALGAVQTEMFNEAFPGFKAPMNAQQMAAFIEDFAINGRNYFNGKILPVNLSNP